MQVKFRNIVNPIILNHGKWIGFQGDSEYFNEDGELIMGAWSFLDILSSDEDDWTLDDTVDESLLSDGVPFRVLNDNGMLCIIRFHY